MQIPPTTSGAQAASGTLAQAGAKDKASAVTGETPSNVSAQVEQLGTSDPDRDAQGQGDGFSDRPKPHHSPEDVVEIGGAENEAASSSSRPPGEPPSELDLLA